MTPQGWRQFLRFGVVGLQGLFVDLAVLYALAPLTNWYLARVVSFWAAASTTWVLNRRCTFGSHHDAQAAATPWRAVIQQYAKYLAAMLAGGALNYLCYFLTLQYLDSPLAAFVGVVLGSAMGLVVNFLLSRHLVFVDGDKVSKPFRS